MVSAAHAPDHGPGGMLSSLMSQRPRRSAKRPRQASQTAPRTLPTHPPGASQELPINIAFSLCYSWVSWPPPPDPAPGHWSTPGLGLLPGMPPGPGLTVHRPSRFGPTNRTPVSSMASGCSRGWSPSLGPWPCTFSVPPIVSVACDLAKSRPGWRGGLCSAAHLALGFPEPPAVLGFLHPFHTSWMKNPLLDLWPEPPACTRTTSQNSESATPAQAHCRRASVDSRLVAAQNKGLPVPVPVSRKQRKEPLL